VFGDLFRGEGLSDALEAAWHSLTLQVDAKRFDDAELYFGTNATSKRESARAVAGRRFWFRLV